jgi:hypothetical protein
MTAPKLPEPREMGKSIDRDGEVSGTVMGYTDDQMLAYAAECVAAERERCAELCEQLGAELIRLELEKLCAAAIRAGADK